MNTLANSSIYLCGQIENDKNATEWRVSLAASLTAIEPTFKIWDPLIKPYWCSPDYLDNSVGYGWKSEILHGDPEKARRCISANREARRICRQLAGKCDIIVARLSSAFTWGSIDELEIGIDRNIPIFLWLPSGLVGTYGIGGIIKDVGHIPYYIHTNPDSLIGTIAGINNGTIPITKIDPETWMYITWPRTVGKLRS